jgi:hypothetical protein
MTDPASAEEPTQAPATANRCAEFVQLLSILVAFAAALAVATSL